MFWIYFHLFLLGFFFACLLVFFFFSPFPLTKDRLARKPQLYSTLGCELSSVVFVIGSNCEEQRSSMHWWVTGQTCCISPQLKKTVFFFFPSVMPWFTEVRAGRMLLLFSLLQCSGPPPAWGQSPNFFKILPQLLFVPSGLYYPVGVFYLYLDADALFWVCTETHI